MGEYARTVPPLIQKVDPDKFEALGNIALADGHYAEALKNFQQMRVDNLCVSCGIFEIAQSFTKLGQPDSALAYTSNMSRRAIWGAFEWTRTIWQRRISKWESYTR